MKKFVSAFLCMTLFFASTVFTVNAAELAAFPGAEGGGMYTTGARASLDPEIYHVTNLNDRGPGSLRDAVSQDNRIIVFDVAGTIELRSRLTISHSNLTILGQTAPGDGICVKNNMTYLTGNNIILRYMRFRMGSETGTDDDALGGRYGNNIIVDHCSMSWSTDECVSIYAVKNMTLQWCLITEPLNESLHDEGSGVEEHGYGGIWGGVNSSFHHNFMSSGKSRFPRIGSSETVSSYDGGPDTESLVDVRNNVIYNWSDNTAYGGENGTRVNFIGNYYKEGPASKSVRRFFQMSGGSKRGVSNWGADMAVAGNYYNPRSANTMVNAINRDNRIGINIDEVSVYNLVNYDESEPGTSDNHTQYIHDYPITTHTAQEAYELVLENAGMNLVRDSVDERAIQDAKSRTSTYGENGIIDLVSDVGGWPFYSGVKAEDSDGDGMSDEYEDEYGLDKSNGSDALEKAESGYFNIEEYANWLAEGNGRTKTTPEPTPEATTEIPLVSGVYYASEPVLEVDTVRAEIVNVDDESGAWFIAAVYKDDIMIDSKIITVPMGETISTDESNMRLDADYSQDSEVEVRFYLWSAGSLEPYTDCNS